MTITMESLAHRIKAGWDLLRHAAFVSWQWIRHQWDAMMQSPGQVSPRQARRAEKQRRKEIRRQLKEKGVRQVA